MEEDPILEFATVIAEEEVNEELSHHQELVRERNYLLKTKTQEVAADIRHHVEEVTEDFKTACITLFEWIEQQPPEKKEKMQLDLKKSADLLVSQDPPKIFLDTEATLSEMLDISDETQNAFYSVAYEQAKQGGFEKARAISRFLIMLNPFNANSWVTLGYAFLNLNSLEEAEFAFTSASQIAPQNPEGLYFLSLTYLCQKKYKEALEQCEKAQELGDKGWEKVLSTLSESIKEESKL